MSNITDAKQVLELLIGKTITNTKAEAIVDMFISYGSSPEIDTAEGKAGLFLTVAKNVVKAAAVHPAVSAVEHDVTIEMEAEAARVSEEFE